MLVSIEEETTVELNSDGSATGSDIRGVDLAAASTLSLRHYAGPVLAEGHLAALVVLKGVKPANSVEYVP